MFFEQSGNFLDVLFLVFLHFLPEGTTVGAVTGVILVVVFDAPERLVFLHHLLHEVIDMIIKHV